MSAITYRQAGQWWAQPNPRLAYYLCLRWIYEMPASEALAYIRRTERDYPGFIGDMMGTLRTAIRAQHERTRRPSGTRCPPPCEHIDKATGGAA